MFTDPQSVTVNAVAQSMPAIKRAPLSSTYRKDDGTYQLTISHQEGRRNRHTVRLDLKKIAADPLTAENTEYTCSVYYVVDAPPVGFTNTELKDLAVGLFTWSSSSNILKILGYES